LSQRVTRALVAIVSTVVMLGTVAACSAKSDNTQATGANGGSPTITLAYSAWPGWFPWAVAQEKGLFAANGVNVQLKYFDNYTDSLTALSTGAVTANSQTLNDTLISVAAGSKQTIVLVNDNSTGNDQIIAAPGINSLADLKGKTIAVEEGTVDHYLLLLALQRAGVAQSSVTIKGLPTADAAAAFKAGQVDAVGAFAPFTTTALQRPGSKALTTSKDFPGAIPDHLVFGSDFVKAHRDLVQKVVKTWFDTLTWISQHHDEALTIMAKQAGVSVADYQTYDAGTTIFTRQQNLDAFTSGMTPANLDYEAGQISQFIVDTKLAPAKPSLDGLFDDSFVKAISP
jgi:NitT/TauT family transport system substrate-binding protein